MRPFANFAICKLLVKLVPLGCMFIVQLVELSSTINQHKLTFLEDVACSFARSKLGCKRHDAATLLGSKQNILDQLVELRLDHLFGAESRVGN